jgi:transcriptional regulator with XRE-family HTH domain
MAINFGDNLKRIRTEKNLSQGELADQLGMHATHLSRYERNVALPSIEVLTKISDVLDVSTDQLIYGSKSEKAKNNIKDQELLSMFNKVQQLDKTELSCVKSLLEAYIFKRDLKNQLAH